MEKLEAVGDAIPTAIYDCVLPTGRTVCFGRPTPDVLSLLDEKHKIIKADYGPCCRHDQAGGTLLGVAFRYSYVCRSCICNAHTALVLRHGVTQPKLSRAFAPFDHTVIDRVATSYAGKHEVYDNWLQKWPANKRVAIARSERDDAFEPSALKPFIKREGGSEPPSRPRLIQGYRTLRTQARYGPEFSTMQKALCEVFDLHGYELYPGVKLTFGSGLNGTELAAWMENVISSFDRLVFYERDGKNWDATMQRDHHELKQLFNKAVSVELHDFVESCFSCAGGFSSRGSDGRLSYHLEGTVKSGHNDTTSGNSLVNGFIICSAMHRLGLKGHAIVAGDDLLTAIEGDFDLEALKEEESALGIVPKAEKFFSPLDVTFISACWLPKADGTQIFVPLLGRLVSRLWWSTHPPSPAKRAAHIYSIVCGLKPAVGEVPLYREFLDAAITDSTKLVTTGKYERSYEDTQTADAHTLAALFEKYDLSESEYEHARGVLSIRGVCTLVTDSVIERIITRDTCSVTERVQLLGGPGTI